MWTAHSSHLLSSGSRVGRAVAFPLARLAAGLRTAPFSLLEDVKNGDNFPFRPRRETESSAPGRRPTLSFDSPFLAA